MKFPLKTVLIGMIAQAVLHCAQSTVTIRQPQDKRLRATKAENGLIISWLVGRPDDPEANQIDTHRMAQS